MSIKKSIVFLFVFLGVSFSAYSSSGYVLINGKKYSDTSAFRAKYSSCSPNDFYGSGPYIIVYSAWADSGNSLAVSFATYSDSSCTKVYSSQYTKSFGYYSQQCPNSQEFNPETSSCETVCTPPEELSPDTNECFLPEFCETKSTWEQIFQAEMACAEKKGIFTYNCSNFFQTLDMRCDEPNVCAMGLPNWPDCLPDPSLPIDPGGSFEPIPGGDAPSTGGIRPDVPDVTPPTGETSDPALLSAIQNMNADLNKSVTTLNNNNVDSFAALNKQLTDLNSTNLGIGQSIVDQMNNDIKIADNNKLLMQQQNRVIADSGVYIAESIERQTQELSDLSDVQTGKITNAIDALADKMPIPCDPKVDPQQCQGPNGLNELYVKDAYSQMISVADTELSAANSTLVNYARVAATDPMTDETQVYIDMAVGDLLAVLPSSSDCVDFPMVTSMGTFTLGCEFSARLKSIISFLVYVFTLWSLVDILLNGVTPVAGTTPYMSRR